MLRMQEKEKRLPSDNVRNKNKGLKMIERGWIRNKQTPTITQVKLSNLNSLTEEKHTEMMTYMKVVTMKRVKRISTLRVIYTKVAKLFLISTMRIKLKTFTRKCLLLS